MKFSLKFPSAARSRFAALRPRSATYLKRGLAPIGSRAGESRYHIDIACRWTGVTQQGSSLRPPKRRLFKEFKVCESGWGIDGARSSERLHPLFWNCGASLNPRTDRHKFVREERHGWGGRRDEMPTTLCAGWRVSYLLAITLVPG